MATDPRANMTERLFRDAGIGAGMRVLDVGCGYGAVSFLVAGLVGASGSVVGIDRDAQALATARERARELGVSHVTFVEADLGAIPPEHAGFDAAVGRRVLMYQPDPAEALRRIATALRPGALVVFEEQDTTMVPAGLAPFPLHRRVHEWVWRTVEREGACLHMGLDLAPALERAGLVVEHVRAEAVVQTPPSHHPTAAIVRAMLPRIERHGVATAAEIDLDTLEDRLRDELAASKTPYVGDMVFGAWARKKQS
jgi:SAM-dependent methyltransferase